MLNPTLPQILRRLWWHISPRRRAQFGLLFLLMVLASFAEVMSIGAVLPFLGALTAPERVFIHPMAQPFIQALGLTEPKQLLFPLTILFMLGALFSGLMRLVLLWAQTRLSFAVGADISFNIYRRTLYQPYDIHVARNSSEVIAGIAIKADSAVNGGFTPLATILGATLMTASILGALLTIDSMIAISAFVGFGAIYVVVILVTKKALERDGHRVNTESTRVFKALQEGLGGIRDVLIDGSQATYCNIYRSADLPLRRAQANISIIAGCPRFGIETLGMLLIAALAYNLAGSGSNISSAIPVLGALALGAQRLLPVLQQAYAAWTSMLGGQASLVEVVNFLDQAMPTYTDEIPRPTLSLNHSIALNNLAFKYTENAPWVLQPNLSLIIQKGSRIGFIGVTGSGKSTLLDIIMGLLKPNNGGLEIDGVSVTEQNVRGWQAHIAHVPQTIFLADISIAENIAFGVPQDDVDISRVQQAAQKAQISQTIESWEKQYDTVVGEQGVRLSGGQRQRIGIARALYKNADVIIFDEATSALDNDTERAVMEAIENLDNEITTLIVAHRLTTLRNCTQIVELENGKIVRIGSYLDIMEQSA